MLRTSITNEQDAREFFNYLVQDLGLNFHPDTPFEDYVNLDTDQPTFDKEQTDRLNALMEQCFNVLGERTYDIAFEEYRFLETKNSGDE